MIWFSDISELLFACGEAERISGPFEERCKQEGHSAGWCDVCESVRQFSVASSSERWIDLRGQFKCAECAFSGRSRLFYSAIIDRLSQTADCGRPQGALILERLTPFFPLLQSVIPEVIGSEYLGDEARPGSLQRLRGVDVRHESLMDLSFPSEELDFVLHQEVLEHVPDAFAALLECHRVLKPGGELLFSTPFFHQRQESEKRAEVVDGEIVHHMPPVYHGDPLRPDGALVFENFGLEFARDFLALDFSERYVGLHVDLLRGFTSNGNPHPIGQMLPILFRAVK